MDYLNNDSPEFIFGDVNYDGRVSLIDLAYQGFGDGLHQDVLGLQSMASKIPNMMIAASCSKNFGVYRDRVGAALVIAEGNSEAKLAEDNLKSLNMPSFANTEYAEAIRKGLIVIP